MANSAGQIVFAGKAGNTLLTIDMTNLPPDVYLLKVENGIKSLLKKIVKK